MSKRKIATMLTGMSTVGIISNVNSVVYATEFDDLTRSSIDSYTSKGTVSTSYYEYDSITSADANYYLGAFAIAGRYTTPGGLHSSQRIKGNGILATDTKYQYYDLNGNTRAVSGMNVIPISDGYYNYDSSWGNKWVYAGGNKYYFKNAPVSNSNSTSEIVYVAGYARIDGKLYYFREERNRHRGKLYTTSGWVDNLGGSSGRRYVYSNGEIATGIRVINGVTYIFDDNGVLQNRPIQINIPSGNVIVQEGKAYDVMTGVTSTDTAGANANSKIKIELNGFNQSNPQPGTYTIRYTLSEGGQTKTANRTIIVKGAPKIYGADDITIGVGVPFDALDGVRATDLEDGDITLTSSNVTFSTGFNPNNPQKGNYTVTYTVRDKDGNTTTKVRKIIVDKKSDIGPTIIAEDIRVNAGEIFNPFKDISIKDDYDTISQDNVNISYSEGFNPQAPKVGVYTVTYTVTDSDGNTTIKVRNIRVIKRNSNAPTIHGADNKVINVNEEFDPMDGVTLDDKEDNPSNIEILVTGPSGYQANSNGKYTFENEGDYTFIYRATDLDGNETVINRVITVKQAIDANFRDALWSGNDLIMTGKMDVIGTDDDINMGKTIIIRDSNGDIAKTISTVNRDYNDGGTGFEVDFTKSDIFDGLKIGETYSVFIRGEMNRKTYESPLTQVINKANSVTNINDLEEKEFNDYKITFRTGVNNQIQIVKGSLADTQKPVIIAPSLSVVRGDSSFNLKNGVTITDNVDSQEDLLGRLEINEGNFDINQAGTYEVTYTVRDAAGNVSDTVTRRVTVTPKTTTPPTITGATDVSIVQGTSFNEKAGVTARAEDGEDLTSKIQVDKKVNVNQVGEQTITYTVTDRDNNTTTVTRKVTVTAKPAENKLPTIYAPMRHEIYVGDNFNPLDIATAVDPEDGPITLTEKNIVFNKVNTQKAGEYEVKYEVIDRNKGRRTKVITVVVKERPVTDRKPTINFPEKTVIKVGSTFNPIADVTATDYKGQPITIENKHVSWNKVNTSAPGDYQVKYTVTDSEGNTKIAYRTVTVEGSAITPPSTDKKPVISFKDNIVINVGDVFNPLAGVTAKDYKGQNIVLNESNVAWNKVNTAQAGTYQVKYRVTDSEGNNKIVYRTVIVKGFTGLRGDASLTSVTLYNNTLRVEGNVNKLTHVVDDKESNVSIIDSKVKYYLVARDADGKEIFKNYMVRVNNGGSYSGFKTNLSLDELNKIQEGKDVTLSLGVETLGTNGELALDGNSLSLPTEIVDSVRNVKYTVSLDGNKVKISKSKNTVTLSESEKVEVEANNAEAIEEAPKSEEVIEENTIVEEATEEVVTEENTAVEEATEEVVTEENTVVEEATEEVVTEENTSEVISDKEILELESELLLEGDLIIE